MHTSHRKHADLVFARTGLARVGTAEPRYDPERRGFVPFVDRGALCDPRPAVALRGVHCGTKSGDRRHFAR